MNWHRTLRNGVLVVVLATVLMFWGLVVLDWVLGHVPIGTWYNVIGRPALFLPELISYLIIGATIGPPTGLLFPRHPLRVALLLVVVWEAFTVYLVGINDMAPLWRVFASDAVEVLLFLPLFAYLGAKLRRRLSPNPDSPDDLAPHTT